MKRLPFLSLSLFLAAALTAAYGGAALAQTAPQPAATSQPRRTRPRPSARW
ncbi:hypothetical protein [Rhizobium sp. G21]|uniref:hypothetical protein n=1 Tax=Rhizobium sp. G21 TaxID=2758439 RepID=UPI001AEE662E|nr:hypothetical protein [Rhizobium sp. G21]